MGLKGMIRVSPLLAAILLVSACSLLGSLDELSSGGDPDAGSAGSSGGTLTNGSFCTAPDNCASGFCVTGVCCDSSCEGECMACTAAAKDSGESDGVCGAVSAGSDPRGDCDEQPAASCGSDGKCDGKGACRKYSPGTPCGATSCSNGTKTLAKSCDGQGKCVEPGTVPCDPPTCSGNLCFSDCVDDTGCADSEYCDTFDNNCKSKLDSSVACKADNECKSAFCVDSVCCDSICDGDCTSCTALLTGEPDGSCAPVAAGTDPDNDCNDQGAISCGTTGQCDGAGKCALYGPSTACGSVSCAGNTQTNAPACDGQGSCQPNGSTDCAPFVCAGSSCGTSCSDEGQCVAGSLCQAQVCQGKKSNGAACGAAVECESGFCVDGVCCDAACAESCKACSAAAKGTGADGVCGFAAAGRDPHDDCTADPASSCDRDGSCNGSGGCRLYPSGTLCAPEGCGLDPANSFSYLQSYADTCDGAGNCVDKGTKACGIYKCAGTACSTSCNVDADCIIGVCLTSHVCYFNIGF